MHGLPYTWVDEHGDDATERMEFYPNSRLLKINSCPNEENCGLYDYVMIDGKGLKLIRKELLPKEFHHGHNFSQRTVAPDRLSPQVGIDAKATAFCRTSKSHAATFLGGREPLRCWP